jgi:hypothetical protein
MRSVALLVACSLVTSCSWAFVTPAPQHHPTDPGDCTASRAAPLLDLTWMSLFALNLLIAGSLCYQQTLPGANQDDSPKEPCGVGPYVGIGLLTVAGVASAASAVSGFRDTRQCRARRAMDGYSVR